MEGLYGQFRNHGEPDYHSRAADKVFDPERAALEHKHQAQMDAGQADFDDGNDLCGGCQDTDRPSWKVATTQQGTDRAISNVQFTDAGQTTAYRFSLRLTATGWRISDFLMVRNTADRKAPPGGYPSFKTQLIASIRDAATRAKGSH